MYLYLPRVHDVSIRQVHIIKLYLPKLLFSYSVLIVYKTHNIFEQKHKASSVGVRILFIKCLKLGLSNKNTLTESGLKLAN